MTAEAKGQIRDHVWRPLNSSPTRRRNFLRVDLPCQFMNCERPRAEHAGSVTGRAA